MGLYSHYIFPRLMDMTMSSEQLSKIRAALLAEVSGDVFEIGVGTGLNLRHYPKHVKHLTTADPNSGMSSMVRRRIEESGIQVTHYTASGESLPFDDASFDSVVCTWTLCSIPGVAAALRELNRILRPSGKLHFVEHGLSHDITVRRWQHRLNPLNKRVGNGCNLNRDMRAEIESQRFELEKIENFYLHRVPKIAGFLYRGVARKG